MKKKISIVGGGNGGVFTALSLSWLNNDYEVELIYNPEISPERVGQATVLDPPKILWAALGFNWYNNPIHATFKSGILYEGWGKVNDKVFHDFPADSMAMHYCPWEMQKYALDSGFFKVVEDNILDINQVDADYVFDCRGKPDDYSDYDELINPTNACILAKPNWDTSEAFWSRHVATPDGWTFVIPTHTSSPSNDYCVGYCYNSNITSKEEAEKNMLEMFDVEVTKHVNYKNYVAKKPIIDDRIFLNGNRLFFLEPLESSSTQVYLEQMKSFNFFINGEMNIDYYNKFMLDHISDIQTFVLWHYQFGSKYDTPFWQYAKNLPFKTNRLFDVRLRDVKKCSRRKTIPTSYGGEFDFERIPNYGQWSNNSFWNWEKGMTVPNK